MIAARVLGSPQVTIDGAPAPAELLWRKHLAVCLLLWTSPDRTCSRAELASMLWGDKDEAAARHSLNEALRVIRRTVGQEALETEGETIRWVHDLTIDLDDFTAEEGNDPMKASTLVGGAFCEGFAIEDAPAFTAWLDVTRRAWGERIAVVLLQAAARHTAAGEHVFAVARSTAALALTPTSDRAARGVIRAHGHAGDPAAALAAGRAFALHLQQTSDAQPEAQTRALMVRIAAGRTPRTHPDNMPTVRRPPFFGRYQILSRSLAITRAATAARQPTMIVLSGDSGSGRSRVLEEIIWRTMLDGNVVSTMRAVDSDLDNPHALWLGLASGGLLDAPGVGRAPTALLAGVAALSPEWAERFPVTRGATGLPLSDAVTGVIRTVADRTPLLLAIDDAHCLGEKGMFRIPRLLRALVEMPVTIVVTLDSGTPSAAADELRRLAQRETPGATMHLDAWEVGEFEQLISWALPDWDDGDRQRLARRLQTESNGRPALAIELLTGVREGLPLDLDTGTWSIADLATEPVAADAIPDSVHSAIRLAVGRLPAPHRQVLLAAAHLPEPVAVGTLSQVVDLADPAELHAILDQLEWERWLIADGRGYSFASTPVRTVVSRDVLTPADRQVLADRMAGAQQ